MLLHAAPCRGIAASRSSSTSVPLPRVTRIWAGQSCSKRCDEPHSRQSNIVRALDTETSPLDSIALKTIEDLDTNYCDDFVCTSSPAVEQIVRSLARELSRGRYVTTGLYQPGVTYSDGFRSFTGPEGYPRQRWIADCVEKPRATISRLRMADKGTSVIEWRLEGSLGGQALDIGFTTTCTHNLLTGRVTGHKETWDLSRCAPPAAALATLNRLAWSAKRAAGDAREALDRAASNLGGGGEGGGGMDGARGTADPTRFYQQDGGGGGPSQDVISVFFLVALLYLASKLYGALEALG